MENKVHGFIGGLTFPDVFSDYQEIPNEKKEGRSWHVVGNFHCHNETGQLFSKTNPFMEDLKILAIYFLGATVFGVLCAKELFLAGKEGKAIYNDFKAAEPIIKETANDLRNSPKQQERTEPRRTNILDNTSEHFKNLENITVFNFFYNNSEKVLEKLGKAGKNFLIFYALYGDRPSLEGISTVWTIRHLALLYFLIQPLSARLWLSDLYSGTKDSKEHDFLLKQLDWCCLGVREEKIPAPPPSEEDREIPISANLDVQQTQVNESSKVV